MIAALTMLRTASAADAYLSTQKRAPSMFDVVSSTTVARPSPISITAAAPRAAEPPSSGPSLATIGAAVVGLGVVAAVVYKLRKGKKKRS